MLKNVIMFLIVIDVMVITQLNLVVFLPLIELALTQKNNSFNSSPFFT